MTRRRGFEKLVKQLWREIEGGLSAGVARPENEEEMQAAQMAEPRYQNWIGTLRRGTRLQEGTMETIIAPARVKMTEGYYQLETKDMMDVQQGAEKDRYIEALEAACGCDYWTRALHRVDQVGSEEK